MRVSTDKQVDHGVSLEAQRTTLDADAALYDIELVAVMVDVGVSAKTLQCPGVPQALGMLKKGEADARRVAQLDRQTRRVKALGTRLDAYFADAFMLLRVADSLDTRTAAGRLGRNVLVSVAQWERATIRERTTEAMHHRNTQGRKTGGDRPSGCTRAADGTPLMADSDAQALRKAIRSARPRGLSQRAVVGELTRQGFTTRKGTPLSVMQGQRIMRRACIAERERVCLAVLRVVLPQRTTIMSFHVSLGGRGRYRSARSVMARCMTRVVCSRER